MANAKEKIRKIDIFKKDREAAKFLVQLETNDKLDELLSSIKGVSKINVDNTKYIDLTDLNKLLKDLIAESKKECQISIELTLE